MGTIWVARRIESERFAERCDPGIRVQIMHAATVNLLVSVDLLLVIDNLRFCEFLEGLH